LPLWEELITSINKRPWLGYGYLAYWDAARVEYLSDTFKWEIPHGHNMYLDIMLDVGFIGLLGYILWYIFALYTAFVRFNETNKIEYAIVIGLGVFAIANGFAESLFKLPTFHLLVLLTAFCSLLFEKGPSRSIPVPDRNRRAIPHIQPR
jgi:O-antigen ligase